MWSGCGRRRGCASRQSERTERICIADRDSQRRRSQLKLSVCARRRGAVSSHALAQPHHGIPGGIIKGLPGERCRRPPRCYPVLRSHPAAEPLFATSRLTSVYIADGAALGSALRRIAVGPAPCDSAPDGAHTSICTIISGQLGPRSQVCMPAALKWCGGRTRR